MEKLVAQKVGKLDGAHEEKDMNLFPLRLLAQI
jgi:hypothetical protein